MKRSIQEKTCGLDKFKFISDYFFCKYIYNSNYLKNIQTIIIKNGIKHDRPRTKLILLKRYFIFIIN